MINYKEEYEQALLKEQEINPNCHDCQYLEMVDVKLADGDEMEGFNCIKDNTIVSDNCVFRNCPDKCSNIAPVDIRTEEGNMNIKQQIIGIFKKKQEIKTEQKELTERIEKALYDTVGEKGFTPSPITINHIDYSQDEVQIFLEAHYSEGMKLCDILRFIDEMNVSYENVWFGLYKCAVTALEGNLFLRIKLTEEDKVSG